MNTFSIAFVCLFGVVLPFCTLAIEYFTGMSASGYFDPIPTIWHALLILVVPVANAVVLRYVLKKSTVPPFWMGYLSALSMFIGGVYAIPYLPLTPIALPGIALYGIGLLPLAPLLSALSALILRRALRSRGLLDARGRVPGKLRAFVSILLILCALETQAAITNIAITLAMSNDESQANRGIQILRNVGDEELLLNICYGRQGRMLDPFSSLFRTSQSSFLTTEKARELYFQVTGTPFRDAPPPRLFRVTPAQGLWMFDGNVGTRTIGQKIEGVKLLTSTFGSSVDAQAALAYTEWTLVFQNDTYTQREARTHISLPSGAVVSRLTLWVNGEEKDATFAARGKVQEAYQRVVSQRRDPVLVTTDGPDRILLQLFPIPPNGGTMKVRIGITSPLALSHEQVPLYRLPTFQDENFEISDNLKHEVWIDSKIPGKAEAWTLANTQQSDGSSSFRGSLATNALAEGGISFEAFPSQYESYTADPTDAEHSFIVQKIDKAPLPPKTRMVAVIDASAGLHSKQTEIEEILSSLKGKATLSILLASDFAGAGQRYLERTIPLDSKNFSEELRGALEAAPFRGGQDDVPALNRALELTQGVDQSMILWWHGPQPLRSQATESLLQKTERFSNLPPIYEVEVKPGENTLLEHFDRIQILKKLPTQKKDLIDFLQTQFSETSQIIVTRKRVSASEFAIREDAHKTSAHLARLWAADEVRRQVSSRDKKSQEAATKLAAFYSIVTPFTGAVVLETQAQYDASGLTPADSLNASIPSIPEPETYALMFIASFFLFWNFRRARSCQNARGVLA